MSGLAASSSTLRNESVIDTGATSRVHRSTCIQSSAEAEKNIFKKINKYSHAANALMVPWDIKQPTILSMFVNTFV